MLGNGRLEVKVLECDEPRGVGLVSRTTIVYGGGYYLSATLGVKQVHCVHKLSLFVLSEYT